MKLNREVCRQCPERVRMNSFIESGKHAYIAPIGKTFDQQWEENSVACPQSRSEPRKFFLTSVHPRWDSAPEWCPFLAEHVVAQGDER